MRSSTISTRLLLHFPLFYSCFALFYSIVSLLLRCYIIATDADRRKYKSRLEKEVKKGQRRAKDAAGLFGVAWQAVKEDESKSAELESNLATILKKVDVDGNGLVDWQEFMRT